MGFVFFFKKYKIGNNDFITILGSENPNSMMFTTNYCSKPTVNVPVGSVTHIESPWTLDITPISLTVGGDLIFWLKNRFITILVGFISESHREVAPLGLEFIGLWFICTKYINFWMRHTQHMYPSYPTITHRNTPCVSSNPSNMIFSLFSTSNWIQTTSDHVPDICPHLLIAPDRLETSNREHSSSTCLDHQKSWFSGKFDIKRDGGCYKSISTVKCFEPFPDWSDTKRVCPYVYWGSRNRLVKSTMCLYPLYWGLNLHRE